MRTLMMVGVVALMTCTGLVARAQFTPDSSTSIYWRGYDDGAFEEQRRQSLESARRQKEEDERFERERDNLLSLRPSVIDLGHGHNRY
jgi:hypothetical protein